MTEEMLQQQQEIMTSIDAEEATKTENTSSNGKKDNSKRKKKFTPPEELFDLTKPIPKANRPNRDEHDSEIAVINAGIDKLKEERRGVHAKIDNLINKRGSTAVGKERDAIRELRSKKGKLIEEKRAIRARLDSTKNQTDRLMNDRKITKAGIKFTNISEIEAEISKLSRKQETTSMSLSEEKRIIKEMDALQASKKLVADLKNKDISIDDAKGQRKMFLSELATKDKELDALQKQIDERNNNIKKLSETETETKEKMQKLFSERDNYHTKIGEKMKERDQLRSKFREMNDKWYDYQRALKAQRQIKYEEEEKQREEEKKEYSRKKQEEEAKKIPYEEEMALCDYLVGHLSRTYLNDRKKASDSSQSKQVIVKIDDDPFAGFKPVMKKNDEVFLQLGKQKKPRNRVAKKKQPTTFTLNVDSFEQFGLLNLSPPTNLDLVVKSIEELKGKKLWYSKQPRGSVATAQDIRKANEKAAAKLRNGPVKKDNGKKIGGSFALSNDDFVPLSTGGSSQSGLNINWGQKRTEEKAVPADEEVEEE